MPYFTLHRPRRQRERRRFAFSVLATAAGFAAIAGLAELLVRLS